MFVKVILRPMVWSRRKILLVLRMYFGFFASGITRPKIKTSIMSYDYLLAST